jgi:hypothetical protein
MAHEQKRKRARRPRHSEREPARERRPALEELGGTSEYQVQSARPLDDGDPMTEVVGIPSGVPEGGPPVEAELSVPPDELGATFLRAAVQDPRPADAEEEGELPYAESDELTSGEQRMLDGRLGAVDSEGQLITALPRRSEEEGELSELTHQAAKEVRTPAELRADRKSEYLGRRRKSGPGPGDAKR